MSAKKRKGKTIPKLLPTTVVSYWRYNPETRGIWGAMSRAAEEAANTKSWPDQCTVPAYVAHSVLKEYRGDVAARKLCSDLTAAWAWDKERIVYRFDYTLASELIAQVDRCKDEVTMPEELLSKLPHRCFFVETAVPIIESPGFFCWTDYEPEREDVCVRLLLIKTKGVFSSAGYLSAAFKLTPERKNVSAAKEYKPLDLPKSITNEDMQFNIIQEALQFVLYLLAVNTETSKPNCGVIFVGKSAGQKLRSSTKSYVRRAHWHHYWVGSEKRGDRRLELKWLPPIPVGKEEMVPRVVDVRGKDENGKRSR